MGWNLEDPPRLHVLGQPQDVTCSTLPGSPSCRLISEFRIGAFNLVNPGRILRGQGPQILTLVDVGDTAAENGITAVLRRPAERLPPTLR